MAAMLGLSNPRSLLQYASLNLVITIRSLFSSRAESL